MIIKVVKNVYFSAGGLCESYGVWINGYPKYIFYSKGECEAFIYGLKGENHGI